MSENTEYNVPQTQPQTESGFSAPQQAAPMSSPVPETPSGDMDVKTPYEYLKDAFDKEVENEPLTLEVPNRPGVWIEFDTNVSSEQFDLWRKQASTSSRRRGQESEIDSVKFSALVIFNKANIFKIDGEGVYLGPGETKPLNFFEQTEIRSLAQTTTMINTELVKAVYANDAHVLAAGQQIIEAAGYGEELEEFKESPTRR